MASRRKGAGKGAPGRAAPGGKAKGVARKTVPAKRGRRATKLAKVAGAAGAGVAPAEINHADELLPDEGLTWRQKMFVEAYLGPARLNATKAAEMAGYADTTRESLAVQGFRLLMNANVQSRVRARLNQIAPTREVLLERIGVLAGSDMADLFRVVDRGGDRPAVELDLTRAAERGAMGLLREYKEQDAGEGGVLRSVKTHDPVKYIEMLAKHVGLLAGGAHDVPRDASPRRLSDQELVDYYQEQGWELPDALDPKPIVKGMPPGDGKGGK